MCRCAAHAAATNPLCLRCWETFRIICYKDPGDVYILNTVYICFKYSVSMYHMYANPMVLPKNCQQTWPLSQFAVPWPGLPCFRSASSVLLPTLAVRYTTSAGAPYGNYHAPGSIAVAPSAVRCEAPAKQVIVEFSTSKAGSVARQTVQIQSDMNCKGTFAFYSPSCRAQHVVSGVMLSALKLNMSWHLCKILTIMLNIKHLCGLMHRSLLCCLSCVGKETK